MLQYKIYAMKIALSVSMLTENLLKNILKPICEINSNILIS